MAKFSVDKSALADLLGRVAPATRATDNPVKIVAGDGKVTMTASNKEITVTAGTSATVEDEGTVLVNFSSLRERVRSLPDGPVKLSVDGTSLVVQAAKSRYRLGMDSRGEFPTVEVPGGDATVFNGPSLLAAVRQVAPAASTEASRAVFCGVLFDRGADDGEGLRLVATDSHRLAVHDLAGEGLSDTSALVPALALSALDKAMGDADQIAVKIDDKSVAFSAADAVLVTRLIAGEYPRYQPLLEVDAKTTWTADRRELVESLRRCEIVLKGATHQRVRLEIGTDGTKVTAAQAGEDFSDEVETASIEGEDVAFWVNPTMLRGGLEVVDGDQVTFAIADPLKPVMVSSPSDPAFRYAVMPVRG